MLSHRAFGKSQRGYSLFELMVVCGIIGVGAAVAIPVTMRMVNDARGDSAAVMTSTFLTTARNRAVAERRNMRLTFNDDDILVQREEVPSGILTTVDSLQLESGEMFDRESGVLNVPGALGGGAVNFPGASMPGVFTSGGSPVGSGGDGVGGLVYIV